MPNPPKIKGTVGKCFKCETEIHCNEKEYNGMVSLQWQGIDGTAHYKKVGENFVCKTGSAVSSNVQSVASKIVENNVNWIPLGKTTKDMDLLVVGLETMTALAYSFSKKMHPDLSENSNLFGQIVNANRSALLELAHIKAIKDCS
tara:strand:+ start:55 stop:489 length:435 start_codon:yes stop_codon:yes gene_type:complete